MIRENLAIAIKLVNIAMKISVYAHFVLNSLSHLCFLDSVTFNISGNVICLCYEHRLCDIVQIAKYYTSLENARS